MIDFGRAGLVRASARSRSARVRPARPRPPTRRKFRRLRPSQERFAGPWLNWSMAGGTRARGVGVGMREVTTPGRARQEASERSGVGVWASRKLVETLYTSHR